jgi:nuclear pore complex protein Nup155
VQKTIAGLTFEQLVTASAGVTVSRALVNILIDEQIGQQVGVRIAPTRRPGRADV